MRIHIRTTPNRELVKFNYQSKMVGVLNKWLGVNELHGKPALYSFSWLLNAKTAENGLNYPAGARFFISFHDDVYLKQVVSTMMRDAEMFCGMRVADVTVEENPDLSNKTRFQCASPVFIKRYTEAKDIHYTYENEESGLFLTETMWRKMELAGLPKDESLNIKFDVSTPNIKTKIIDYRGIKNRVNFCPVLIEGKPETKLFAWNTGLGNSTGIGFGAIY